MKAKRKEKAEPKALESLLDDAGTERSPLVAFRDSTRSIADGRYAWTISAELSKILDVQVYPVYVVSVSLRIAGATQCTERWTADKGLLAWAHNAIEATLLYHGDSARERQMRTQRVLYRHRMLTAEEVHALPVRWQDACPHHEGGPVAILWSKGDMPSGPGVQPCEDPFHQGILGEHDPDLWLPGDCQECEPCLARLMASAPRMRRGTA